MLLEVLHEVIFEVLLKVLIKDLLEGLLQVHLKCYSMCSRSLLHLFREGASFYLSVKININANEGSKAPQGLDCKRGVKGQGKKII